MKRISIIIVSVIAALVSSCHEPEYVLPTADRQGLTSLTAIFTFGPYVDQELAKLTIEDDGAERYEIPIPFFFPETSSDETLIYMTKLRVQAELQPNFKISPTLGILDLTEENWFDYTDPKGNTRKICITGTRTKGTLCDLVSFSVDDLSVSGIIYKDGSNKLQIPYLDDMSAVSVSAQVSPHATLQKINGKNYVPGQKYNMNSGATVTVLAHDGKTTRTYTVEQSIPELLDIGLRQASIEPLFNLEAVSMLGLPAFNEEAFVSLAVNDSKLAICTGSKTAPIYVNGYNGSKLGEVNVSGVTADVIANDEGGHVLFCNYAEGGSSAGEVKIYCSSSFTETPTLLTSFTNFISEPVGHRMKIVGDVAKDAVIVLTAEGIAGVTTTAKAIVIRIDGGTVVDTYSVDFAGNGLGWGAAPVSIATVVPASATPWNDGWYVDYYENNSDPSVTDTSADSYILHHISAKGKDSHMALAGNWANNPNCLDLKHFNGASYMSLFVVSHFPCWGADPRLYLYDATSAGSISEVLVNKNIKNNQTGTYDGVFGATGDIAMWASLDGYRFFVFYYDHHAQTVGGYVADCFNI